MVDRLVVDSTVMDGMVEHGLVDSVVDCSWLMMDSVVDCCWLMVDSVMSAVVNNSMVGSGQSKVKKHEGRETLHLERSWLLVVVAVLVSTGVKCVSICWLYIVQLCVTTTTTNTTNSTSIMKQKW